VETIDDPMVYASEMTQDLFARFVSPVANKFGRDACNAVDLLNSDQCAVVGDRFDQTVSTKVKTFIRTVGQKATDETLASDHVESLTIEGTKLNTLLSTPVNFNPALRLGAWAVPVAAGLYYAVERVRVFEEQQQLISSKLDDLEHAVWNSQLQILSKLDEVQRDMSRGFEDVISHRYKVSLNKLKIAYKNAVDNENHGIKSGDVWSNGLDELFGAAREHQAEAEERLKPLHGQERSLKEQVPVLYSLLLAITAKQERDLGSKKDDENVRRKWQQEFGKFQWAPRN